MNVTINPFKANGEINAPPSKSYAHRYIICAFLSGKECVIKNVGNSDDVIATLNAIKSLGGEFSLKDGDVYFCDRKQVDNVIVDCSESGSTMRFLLPVACALGVNATFTGKGRLMNRPIKGLVDAINGHGAIIENHTTKGKLKSGKYYLDASESSQYVTGLLFALSLFNEESEIILRGEKVSFGYVYATVFALQKFGVKVKETQSGFIVQGGYKKVDVVSVEGDWSGAAFMLAIGTLCGRVTVKNLVYPTLQPDGKIIEVLKNFGAKITIENNSITAEKSKLVVIENIDCENSPDIAQVICAVVTFAKGQTKVTGLSRLKLKESDRCAAILNMLKVCGIKADYFNDSIIITGGMPKGGIFDGGNDHRTVMSSAVIASACTGTSEIIGAEVCAKSYPTFFEDLRILGGKENVSI